MASDQKPPAGPDLAQGVFLGDLAQGKPLVGQVAGEAVLLVRRGEDVLAVSATCTHYGAPLGEGIVVGDTVRCPWHHACFSLRTGAAVRAPALSPLSCYRVERAGDLVRVGEKISMRPRASRPDGPAAIVIIGAGAAANAAAETLRSEGFSGLLTVVGREESLPYDRPNLSKDYLAGTAPEEWIPLRSEDFYRERQIDLVRGVAVQGIDVPQRRVVLADGRSLPWDRLLIATGADPVRLDVSGAELPHVRTLRSLADGRGLIAAVAPGKRVLVVGASFIGMEVAAALRARGMDVHVVAPDACPFERTLGPDVGDFMRSVHAEHGVVFHLGATLARIEQRTVTLTGGASLDADLVVVGIGVRPAVDLARRAGLAVDHGIVVDFALETSAPGVFAAGDVARWPDARTGARVRVEHWVVAERMGQTAARNMLGERRPFDAVPFFWTSQYDVTLSYVGHAERWDRIDADGRLEARDCALAYRAGERTLAVATIGRDSTSLEAELAFEQGDEARLRRLVPGP